MKPFISKFQKWANMGIAICFLPPDSLSVRAPKSILTQPMLEEISLFKPAIISWFYQQQVLHEEFEERAAICEYEGDFTRIEAEDRAYQLALRDFISQCYPAILSEFESVIRNKTTIN